MELTFAISTRRIWGGTVGLKDEAEAEAVRHARRVPDLGLRGFRGQGLVFGVWCLVFGVWDLGIGV